MSLWGSRSWKCSIRKCYKARKHRVRLRVWCVVVVRVLLHFYFDRSSDCYRSDLRRKKVRRWGVTHTRFRS